MTEFPSQVECSRAMLNFILIGSFKPGSERRIENEARLGGDKKPPAQDLKQHKM